MLELCILLSCMLDHRYYFAANSQKHGDLSLSINCEMFVCLWSNPGDQTSGMCKKNRNLLMTGISSRWYSFVN